MVMLNIQPVMFLLSIKESYGDLKMTDTFKVGRKEWS